MQEPWKHDAEQEKPDPKGQVPPEATCENVRNRQIQRSDGRRVGQDVRISLMRQPTPGGTEGCQAAGRNRVSGVAV